MANGFLSAQQPDLNSFIVLPRMPEGCVSFIVPDDRQDPHLRAGEVAIIDPDETTPDHGDLFLVRFDGGRQQIVETRRQKVAGDLEADYWQLCWNMKMWAVDGSASRTMRWGDGPYSTASAASKIIGRVVAIMQPAFEGPIREVA